MWIFGASRYLAGILPGRGRRHGGRGVLRHRRGAGRRRAVQTVRRQQATAADGVGG